MNALASVATNDFQDWIGRQTQSRDVVTGAALAGLAALLDRGDRTPPTGARIPPLGHWFFCLPHTTQGEIGPDGLPNKDSFSPPVPLPRRMWAGGRLRFHHAVHVGDEITRTSTIRNVQPKHGRNGALVFLTMQHEIANARGVAITEEIDAVYREEAKADAPAREPVMAPTNEEFGDEIVMDVLRLFRYSAITFNAHRIHYDRPWATGVEGYPGLVVHGPLIATLLADLFNRKLPDARLESFEFKAMSPLFDTHPFRICGRKDGDGAVALWARSHTGELAMMSRATYV
jgi:3-methylfumaryl-CoA hydratase